MVVVTLVPNSKPFYREDLFNGSPQLDALIALVDRGMSPDDKSGLGYGGSTAHVNCTYYNPPKRSQIPKKKRIQFVYGRDGQPPVRAAVPHTFAPLQLPLLQLHQPPDEPQKWHGSHLEGPNFSFPDAQQPLRLRVPPESIAAQAQLQTERAAVRYLKFQTKKPTAEQTQEEFLRLRKQRQQTELRRVQRANQLKKKPCRRGYGLGQKAKKREKLRAKLAAEGKTLEDR